MHFPQHPTSLLCFSASSRGECICGYNNNVMNLQSHVIKVLTREKSDPLQRRRQMWIYCLRQKELFTRGAPGLSMALRNSVQQSVEASFHLVMSEVGFLNDFLSYRLHIQLSVQEASLSYVTNSRRCYNLLQPVLRARQQSNKQEKKEAFIVSSHVSESIHAAVCTSSVQRKTNNSLLKYHSGKISCTMAVGNKWKMT